MREVKCANCANAREVVFKNGIRHMCALSPEKALKCLATAAYYVPVLTVDDIKNSESFQKALKEIINERLGI